MAESVSQGRWRDIICYIIIILKSYRRTTTYAAQNRLYTHAGDNLNENNMINAPCTACPCCTTRLLLLRPGREILLPSPSSGRLWTWTIFGAWISCRWALLTTDNCNTRRIVPVSDST